MLRIIGTGNLTKDPEEIKTTTGKTVCKMTLAENSNYTKNGEKQVQFWTLIAWNKLAENCLKYLKKGSKIAIEGNPQNRVYEKDGVKKYIFEIVLTEIEFLSTSKKDKTPEDCEQVNDESLPF